MKNIHKNQTGFSPVHIVAIVVLVGVIGFVIGNVVNTQRKNQASQQAAEQAQLDSKFAQAAEKDLALAEQSEEKTESEKTEDETTQDEPKKTSGTTETVKKKPTDTTTDKDKKENEDPDYYKFSLTGLSAEKSGSNVVVSASLDKSRSGKCKLYMKKKSDTSVKKYYETTISSQSTCSLNAPLADVEGELWHYYMEYHNDKKTVKANTDWKDLSI
ncbi:MAG: hypothetical protein U5K77_03690 [Candidatus Saccharibacteria bacterium]|nr:hypothetical protein [Candidatus Saccharibacteria bacterium]